MNNNKYQSIRSLAARGPVSEYGLRRMLHQHMLPGIYVGSKYLVNVEQFDAMLESVSAKQDHRGKPVYKVCDPRSEQRHGLFLRLESRGQKFRY